MRIDTQKRTELIKMYLRHKLHLLPIAEANRNKLESGKSPLTTDGYKGASSRPSVVREFFVTFPDANLAVATGTASNVLVLDVDPRHGGAETLSRLEEELGKLPKTWRSRTSRGGEHIFFEWPSGLKLTRDTHGKIFGSGIDVLGNCSYAIVPPSVHFTGHVYRWRDEKALEHPPARLPSRWRKALKKCLARKSSMSETEPSSTKLGPIEEGHRNDSLFRIAAAWRAGGANETELLERLQEVNSERCVPPLDGEELAKIAKSAASYASPSAKLDLAGVLAEAVLADQFSNGAHLVHWAGQFYRFGGTCWIPMTEDQLKKAILQHLRQLKNRAHLKSASLMSEVTAILRVDQDSDTDIFAERANPLQLVNCENGEVRLRKDGTIRLRSHRPSSGQLHTLPVKYDPDSKCPMYDRALEQIFANAKDKRGLVRHWHELVGYVIQPTRPFPIIVVLLGKGANGKTRLLSTITRLLGPQATYFGNVEHLEGNRFSLGALKGKLLFADDDVKIRLKLPDGILKKISEAKPITGEEKYKNPTTFTSRAVPFLLCNGIPFLSDVTNGMMRRLHIIPFDREFSGEERDPALFERIWAKELPGILNRSLQGWARLNERGDFDIPRDARRVAKKWLVHANPVSAFVDEGVTRSVEGRIPLKTVYERFVQWARDAGIQRSLTRQAFGVDLENLGFVLKKSNGERVVYGLTLR